VLRLALQSGYSRIPVLGESIDDIIGVAYLKDLVRAEAEADGTVAALAEVMRPAVFVPDSKRVDELLKEMQAARNHMAIVVDEYGGTAGVVTIEDILEEIVGEITDEYDEEEVPDVQELDRHCLRVSARLPVEDLAELFPGVDGEESPLTEVLTEADVDTVGGLLAHQLGRVPLPGSEVEVAGLHLCAEGGKDARGRVRIITVLVTPPPDETTAAPASGENGSNGAPEEPDAAFAPHRSGVDGPGDTAAGRPPAGSHRDGAEVPAGRREETDVRPG